MGSARSKKRNRRGGMGQGRRSGGKNHHFVEIMPGRTITPPAARPATRPAEPHVACDRIAFRIGMSEISRRSVDVGESIDHGPWTAFQKLGVLLAALAIVLDGFDGQLIGLAIPVIIKEWAVTREDFAPVVAAGLVGMGFGSVLGGWICDCFGRRPAIIGSVLLFGIATSCIGFAENLASIAAFRFIAGLGIGGALPCSSTIAAELTSLNRRTLAITATIVCVPVGGMLAGLYAGYVLPQFGWRALFFMGGVPPAVLSIVLIARLPESPRFLVRKPERWGELRRLLGRMSRPVGDTAVFIDPSEQRFERRVGLRALFEADRVRDTLALWVAFFLSLLAVYTAFSWLPTMLASEGANIAIATGGLTAYNLGGVVGAVACALAVTRFGSRWPVVLCCAGGALSAFVLEHTPVANTGLMVLGLGLHGLFVNAAQVTMFALSAHVYPTNVRATGTAWAMAFGRFGAILSAFAGAAIITAGGAAAYFATLGVAMSGVMIALMLVRNHIPGLRAAEMRSKPERVEVLP
jgi:MFS transporter, AAHS family, 4-hydroxybenzoate transporter